MSRIELKNLKKVYDNGFEAVKGIDLVIEDGCFVVFVGPSGCGKTTTLRMIAGLESITDGDLLIDDQRVNDLSPKYRDLAMVFQNYALYPHMTVYDNIAYPLKLRKIDKNQIDDRVHSVAKQLELEDLLKRKPGQLSGGQNQRVALGRAIIREPKAFLMDEPLSNLDAKLRVTMRNEITSLQKSMNKTFIYVTHDQVEAMTMGDAIVVMDKGKIMQAGSPEELYNDPDNSFVASFIGSPAMNLIRGENGMIALGDKVINTNYDEDILLGFRPENLSLDSGDITFKAYVTNVEKLGAENYIYLKVGDEDLILRDFDKNDCEIGKNIEIFVNEENMLMFDEENGHRLRDIKII